MQIKHNHIHKILSFQNQKYTEAYGGPADDKFVQRVLRLLDALSKKGLNKLRAVDANSTGSRL